MVAPFPPPLGGAAKVAQAVRHALEAERIPVETSDTSAGSLGHQKSLAYHVERLRGVARSCLLILSRARRIRTLYLFPDAGFGVWYSLVYGILAALFYYAYSFTTTRVATSSMRSSRCAS